MASTKIDAESIVKGWETANRADAVVRWRWAKQLAQWVADQEYTVRAAAKALKRSSAFVGRGLSAAKAFANEPREAESAQKFLDVLYGNGSRKTKGTKGMTADQALTAAIRFAKQAVKLGTDSDEVEKAIAEALKP